MKLGTLLIRDGVINLDQLEAALRAQVLLGGKLGTSLVELGHLRLDTLGVYLGKILHLPTAGSEMFESASQEVLASVPGELAQLHAVFPLAVTERGDNRELALAMASPRDSKAISEIEQASTAKIVPYAAPELRIFYYIEKRYGLERHARFVRLGAGRPARPKSLVRGERRRVIEPSRPPRSGPLRIEPRGGTGRAVPVTPASVSLAEAMRRMEYASARDDVAEAILGYASGRAGGCLLLLLKGELAIGWRGFAPGLDADAIEKLTVPLGSPSILSNASNARETFRGAPGAIGVDRSLFETLRLASPPSEVVVVPVCVGKRVLNLIYAHAPDQGAVQADLVDGLRALAMEAGDTFLRLIKEAKRKSLD